MAKPLPAQLRTMVDELASQPGVPPGAAHDIEAAIASSPYLAAVMVDAANQQTLKRIGVSAEKHEGGHYDKDSGTVYLSVDGFTSKASAATKRHGHGRVGGRQGHGQRCCVSRGLLPLPRPLPGCQAMPTMRNPHLRIKSAGVNAIKRTTRW